MQYVYWSPFKLKGFSQAETLELIHWAIGQVNMVCGADVRFTNKRTGIEVQGMATNDYAGRADSNDVWLSVVRNMSGRDGYVAGGILLHELGHTKLFRWKHDNSSQRNLMHSWGPSDDWYAPAEVLRAQARHGEPKSKFWPHEMSWLGRKLRERLLYIHSLIKLRDESRDVKFRKATHATILREWSAYGRDSQEWFRRVNIWRSHPFANTPNIAATTGMSEARLLASAADGDVYEQLRLGGPICAAD